MLQGLLLASTTIIVVVLIIIKSTYDTKKSVKEFKADYMASYLRLTLNNIFKDFENLVNDLEQEQETGDEPRFGYIYLHLADYIKTDILIRQSSMGDYNRNNNLLYEVTEGMNILKFKLKNTSCDGFNPTIISSIFALEDKIINTRTTIIDILGNKNNP